MSLNASNRPTRDERLFRQQFDEGDPDDVVFFKRGGTSAIYHDDRGCTRLKQVDDEEIDEDLRGAEQRRWHGPCLQCVLEGLDRARLVTDGGLVKACPNCDSTHIHVRTSRPASVETSGRYGCPRCGAEFDQPVERPSRNPSARTATHGLARELELLDDDRLRTDGWVDARHPWMTGEEDSDTWKRRLFDGREEGEDDA